MAVYPVKLDESLLVLLIMGGKQLLGGVLRICPRSMAVCIIDSNCMYAVYAETTNGTSSDLIIISKNNCFIVHIAHPAIHNRRRPISTPFEDAYNFYCGKKIYKISLLHRYLYYNYARSGRERTEKNKMGQKN